jgi:hypothetical protein
MLIGNLNTASSGHEKGVNVGCVDGSIQFVGDKIDVSVWQSLGTIDNGDEVSDEANDH